MIEDAAHAIEAWYHGRKVGTLGDLSCFSFYVTKNLVTGEGGMVTTANEEWAHAIERWGLHGLSRGAWKRYSDEGFRHYEVVYPGFKYNMMDIQAAMGIHQLRRVDANHARREQIWARYDDAFAGPSRVHVPAPAESDTVHARHLYTLLLDIDEVDFDRDGFSRALFTDNIGTGIHFVALHLHPFYQETYGYRRGQFPNAEWVSRKDHLSAVVGETHRRRCRGRHGCRPPGIGGSHAGRCGVTRLVDVISPAPRADWDRIVAACPYATFHQTRQWAEAYQRGIPRSRGAGSPLPVR